MQITRKKGSCLCIAGHFNKRVLVYTHRHLLICYFISHEITARTCGLQERTRIVFKLCRALHIPKFTYRIEYDIFCVYGIHNITWDPFEKRYQIY